MDNGYSSRLSYIKSVFAMKGNVFHETYFLEDMCW